MMYRLTLLLVVGLIGCDVCAVDPEGVERLGLPLCPPEEKSDGGVQQDSGPEGEAWRISGDRIHEPNRTIGSWHGPDPNIITVRPTPPQLLLARPVTSAEYTVTVVGEGCVEGEDPNAGRFYVAWEPTERGIRGTYHVDCSLKLRNDADPDELAQRYDTENAHCARRAGFELEPTAHGGWWLSSEASAQEYVLQQNHYLACSAQLCAQMNTFDAADEDADGQNDSCDCSYVGKEPEDRLDRTCTSADPDIPPGWLTCVPGAKDLICDHRFPTMGDWYRETIHPGYRTLSEASPETADADYAASEIEYDHEDGIPANCPPGAQCDAQSARRRGRLYEKWICQRLLGQMNPINLECKFHTNPLRRNPTYRAEAWQASLNRRPPRRLRRYLDQQFFQIAGIVRYPDYKIKGRNATVLGEAKCYSPHVDLNENSWWQWMRAVGYTAQAAAYLSKARLGRDGRNDYVIHYHFCSSIPPWLRNLVWFGFSGQADVGNWNLSILDGGGRNFIQTPVMDSGLSIAVNLFQCFVPGMERIGAEDNPDNPDVVDASMNCLGAWYDHIGGSE